MVSVARQFPAWRQPDGSVWFRPADGDGWTADPEQAHADYRVVIAPDGSVLTWDGDPDAPADRPHSPADARNPTTTTGDSHHDGNR
ncbi:hypothetical protein PBI_SDCHARGE11_52 [Mycobacterium phage SDcharge11]|uniref:Uncharacterized protein n=1 Tax=Mycobacterium phage SDcharge11 TaxID=1327775 RepID=R4JNV4_9CAUD|nr:hypothetical protein PBI_SDCHARGE11_52 [Mycobacterium phage SDcharge11]